VRDEAKKRSEKFNGITHIHHKRCDEEKDGVGDWKVVLKLFAYSSQGNTFHSL
jgi:hypothetical protein